VRNRGVAQILVMILCAALATGIVRLFTPAWKAPETVQIDAKP